MSEIKEERLLAQRDYYLHQIKNLEFELAIDPSSEDESQIKKELKQAFSDLDKTNLMLSEFSKKRC